MIGDFSSSSTGNYKGTQVTVKGQPAESKLIHCAMARQLLTAWLCVPDISNTAAAAAMEVMCLRERKEA